MPSQERPTDLYPSRQGQEQYIERQDPTVYAPKDKMP